MTTDVRIRVNGNYVAEGTLTVRRNNPPLGESAEHSEQEIKISGVGRKEPIEQIINIPHDSSLVIDLTERPATQDEIDAAAQLAAESGGTAED